MTSVEPHLNIVDDLHLFDIAKNVAVSALQKAQSTREHTGALIFGKLQNLLTWAYTQNTRYDRYVNMTHASSRFEPSPRNSPTVKPATDISTDSEFIRLI